MFFFFLLFLLQTENAEQGVSHSQFMSLVQNLLRDPDERSSFFQVHFGGIHSIIAIVQKWLLNFRFYQEFFVLWCTAVCPALNICMYWHLKIFDIFVFQEVFPGDFGPTYDKAIQTLMWLFLSRLEKLFPTQTLQQVNMYSCILILWGIVSSSGMWNFSW